MRLWRTVNSSTPRKKGDELLLAAAGDGWVEQEIVIREMMRFVMPGQAHRAVAKSRVEGNDDDPRRRDELRVGSRQVANSTFGNALRFGVWIRDGDRVRHRDHPGEQLDEQVAAPELVPDPVVEPEPDPKPNASRPPRVALDSEDSVVTGALNFYGADAPAVLRGYADEADRRLRRRRRRRVRVVNGERTEGLAG